MRKLASIQKIIKLEPIEGADKIEKATVLGWELVVKKGEFKEGDSCVYCEIDSVLPDKPEFEFLKDRKFRIKTIKLRGQVSQGICFPVDILPYSKEYFTGMDVTEILGVKKYLSPSEQNELDQIEARIKRDKNKLRKFMMRYSWFRRLFLSRTKKSGFPYWVSKTDEERIQNIPHVLEQFKDYRVYVTEKIDYQSGTWTGKMIPRHDGWIGRVLPKKYKFVVCSRNLTNNNKKSLYWTIAKKYNLEEILRKNPNITIQGEQGDRNVQSNRYGLLEPKMWVFNIIDHETGYHYSYSEMVVFCKKYGLDYVPLLNNGLKLSEIGTTVKEIVEYSKGKSVLADIEREGVVVRCIEKGQKLLSFKCVNPDYLLKYGE